MSCHRRLRYRARVSLGSFPRKAWILCHDLVTHGEWTGASMEPNPEAGPPFCLPFNGDPEFAREMARHHPGKVYEFYGTDDRFTSGRASQQYPAPDLASLVDDLGRLGVHFNYLLNAFNVDQYLMQEADVFRHLEGLREAGVRTVTCSVPHFVPRLSRMGFEVSASLMQFVRSEQHITHLGELGYDRIILDEDITRMLPQIRALRETTDLPFEVLINSTCLFHCPYRFNHCNVNSISAPGFSDEARERVKNDLKVCKLYWKKDLEHLLKGSWMRPGDLEHMRHAGVTLFKIAGRDKPTDALRQVVDFYLAGSNGGSIFRYLKPKSIPEAEFGIPDVDDNELDEFFSFFFDPMLGCDGGCKACGHCTVWAGRLKSRQM